jgi:putative membrane protein
LSKQEIQKIHKKSLMKGLLAGLVGGLVATAAKTLAEKIYPPREHGEQEPPMLLAKTIAGHELTVTQKTVSTEAINWSFGAVAGATYGAVAEYYPAATASDGASFGLALVSLTHEGALPLAGFSNNPENQTEREKSSEMVTHIVYGIVTETVRRVVRRMLR